MDERSPEVERIQDEQGWTDDTILMFALRFITQQGLDDQFDAYLQQMADEDKAEYEGSLE